MAPGWVLESGSLEAIVYDEAKPVPPVEESIGGNLVIHGFRRVGSHGEEVHNR